MSTILPSAVAAAIKACVAACTVSVTPGNYGALTLENLAPPMGATIDLTGSTFTSIYMLNDQNLTITGGTVMGTGDAYGRCWNLDSSQNMVLEGNAANGCGSAGFTLSRSVGVTLDHWVAPNMLCDGVDIVGSSNVNVTNGTQIGSNDTGPCHPDAIQGWSYQNYIVQNVLISGNVIVSGNFLRDDGVSRGQQGIDMWNGNGPNAPGGPNNINVQVINNSLTLYGGACVAMYGQTSMVVQGNQCFNLNPEPWPSKFTVTSDSTGTVSNNQVDGRPALINVAAPVAVTAAAPAPD